MAKVNLNKIIPIKNIEDKTVIINEQQIIIKQYLPIDDKLSAVENILNAAIDNTNDFSYAKIKVYYAIELLKAYTNISFTEAQLKSVTKTYDTLVLNNIIKQIEDCIPIQELLEFQNIMHTEENRIKTYFHSAAGVLSTIQQDYASTDMNVEGLIQKLNNGESFELVKDILTKVD